MWQNFYGAGGFGMYPTSLFGFALVAVSMLFAFRPSEKLARVTRVLGMLTLASGLLGSAVGICNASRYISQVPAAEQLQTLALGWEESLHCLVLALMLTVVGSIIALVGMIRAGAGAGEARARSAGT